MKPLKTFYLAAAVFGTIVPWLPFFPFLIETKAMPNLIISALYANGAAAGLTNDFFISCVVFFVFVFVNRESIGVKKAFLLMFAAPVIGLSMALPTYLFLRER